MRFRRLAALCFAVVGGACVENAPAPLAGNVLTDIEPYAARGIAHPQRLTDGLASEEGDFWLTGLVARFREPRASVEWDLGAEKPLRCGLLQGDNNDDYHLWVSSDRQAWRPLWTAAPVTGAGLRQRTGMFEATGRYVRLDASGGDGLYAVSELALFSECPKAWPDVGLARSPGVPLGEAARAEMWMLLAGIGFFLAVHRRGGPRWAWLAVGPPVVVAYLLVRDLAEIYPLFDEEPALRAVIALAAAAVLIKEAFLPARFAPDPRVARGLLAVLALAAVGSYYHYGALQFGDSAKGRRTFVHTFDMRHYFPVAKYFPELRFDGLYLASLAAYVDLHPEMTEAELEKVRLRDLTNYRMRSGLDVKPQLDVLRARFSPARWEEFKRDMRYFMDTMGPDYLGSMQDHGGNATPVWLIAAWLVFKNAPASELSLSLAGFIDPVLILVLFVVIWRTFGLRVMLYVAIVFGATDFYNFGSNLMGSTLRQDWLVALGLGACALKRGRPFLGGFLLTYAGLIRAFPAVAAMFLAVPLLWVIVERVIRDRIGRRGAEPAPSPEAPSEPERVPLVRDLLRNHRPALRAIGGAAAGVAVLVALSTGLFGWKTAWSTWFEKIAIHAHSPSTNNVGLRNVMAFDPELAARNVVQDDHPEPWDDWQRFQIRTLAKRRYFFYAAIVLALGLTLLACRGRPLHQAAMLGLLTVPFLFYPSNYYCHFVFLLPLGVAPPDPKDVRDRTFAWVGIVLMAMCVGQYFTLAEGWSDLRYTYQSFVLLGGCALILIPLGVAGFRAVRAQFRSLLARPVVPEPPPEAAA